MQQGIEFDDVVADARAKAILKPASSDKLRKRRTGKSRDRSQPCSNRTRYSDHVPHGIDDHSDLVQAALAQGQCYKLIATVTG